MSSYKAQLNAALRQRGLSSAPSVPTTSFIGTGGGDSTDGISFLKVGGTFLIAIFIILLILAIVHYTIRPIFKLKPSDKGFIKLPGISDADDSEIYWETLPHGDLDENNTIFGISKRTPNTENKGNPSYKNYSLTIDLYFDNLNSGASSTGAPRKVFCRYNHVASTNTSDGLQWSILMEMKRHTNDLMIKVRTANIEPVILTNIVEKTPMRVGIIVSEKFFEVYRDGKLVKTVITDTEPLAWVGAFWGDPGAEPTIYSNNQQQNNQVSPNEFNVNPTVPANPVCPGAVQGPLGVTYNLHLWRREISPEEMRDAMPRLLKPDEFGTMIQAQQGITVATSKVLNQLKQASGQLAQSTTNLMNTIGTRVGGAAAALAGANTNP